MCPAVLNTESRNKDERRKYDGEQKKRELIISELFVVYSRGDVREDTSEGGGEES